MSIQIENEIVLKPINQIKPYLKNPRTNEKTVDLLCKIIPVVGFNVPIVIDSKGVIVKGHARYTAALRLGMEELPCIVTHASAKAIRADRLTDNKIQEFTQWDSARLKDEVGEVDFDELGIDIYEFGFESMDFDTLTQEEMDGGEVQDNRKKSVTVTITFKNVDEFRADEEHIREFLQKYDGAETVVGLSENQ